MSYSRHAVHDDHLHSGSNPLVNFKVWLIGCLFTYLFVYLFVCCFVCLLLAGTHERAAADERQQQERAPEEQGPPRQQGRQRAAGAGQRGSHGETELSA